MMKRFFTAMLGSLAGIWLSVILFMALFFLFIIVLAAIGGSTKTTANLTENTVLYLDLSGTVDERAPEIDWMSEIYGNSQSVLPLNDVLNSLKAAANDDRVVGVYINCDGASAGIASREAIFDAIMRFKESGKWVQAYADSYTEGDYYLATTADIISLNPLGAVDIKGLSATTYFYKGLLDKIGVEMQVVKVGTYKSAVEPYLLTEMSEASRRQQEHYIGNIWSNISRSIAERRNMSPETVNQWADSITVTQPAQYCIDNGIVDTLVYRHESEKHIATLCNVDKFEDVNLITPSEYCQIENVLNPDNSSNNIAILYATGSIIDQGDEGIVGRTMAPEILELAEDDDIKALVLRVNSGGGSAFASEQIWEALEQFKATGKPFYVSMGDVAASGGYYISCGADRIYAEPTTLTGSIGIFGLIPCIKGLLNDKLGITQGTVSTNANSDFISASAPMTPYQRNSMQRMVEDGYETFVGRCAQGRGMNVDSIKAIAEGRVWDGQTALEIGLVDQLGGLEAAVSDIADELGFETYAIKEYPSTEIDFMKTLMKGKKTIKEKIIANELGDAYQYYEAISRLKGLEPLQCRMETVVIE